MRVPSCVRSDPRITAEKVRHCLFTACFKRQRAVCVIVNRLTLFRIFYRVREQKWRITECGGWRYRSLPPSGSETGEICQMFTLQAYFLRTTPRINHDLIPSRAYTNCCRVFFSIPSNVLTWYLKYICIYICKHERNLSGWLVISFETYFPYVAATFVQKVLPNK